MAVRSGRTAEDLDVSGGLPIRGRPKIGKLLGLEFLDEWDVLKGRSSMSKAELIKALRDH